MFFGFDIWRPALIDAPLEALVRRQSLDGLDLVWLPPQTRGRFLADPFAIERDGLLHIFVEDYDYRERHGRIRWLAMDEAGEVRDQALVLAEPWHLSYPYVFAAGEDVWMLPEAFRSGALHLYRAIDFPRRWQRVARLDLPHAAIDATPVWWNDRWWLFHSAAGTRVEKVSVLHLAFADRLEGPWQLHPASPVRRDLGGARPGGTPIIIDGRLALPMQDCRSTYGGAIRWLFVEELTPERCRFAEGPLFTPPPLAAPFKAGLHTMAAAGSRTLIDVKRFDRSPALLAIEARRWLHRRMGGRVPTPGAASHG